MFINEQKCIEIILSNYKERIIEKVYNYNLRSKIENTLLYEMGLITENEWNCGISTISWCEVYSFFPCVSNKIRLIDDPNKLSPSTNIRSLYNLFKEAYDYNCEFVNKHINHFALIFNTRQVGLDTCLGIILESLKIFSPYSDKAKELLEKLNKLE